MTERERFEFATEKIRLLSERGWKCEKCGKPLTAFDSQLAHRVPQTKGYLKKYGKKVIHHKLNMACVCSLKCNAAMLCDPKTRPIDAKRLLEKINEELENGR